MTRMTRLLLVLMVLTLTLPTLAHASDYDTESRLLDLEQRALDLELSMIYQRQALADAESRAASAERKAELDAIFSKPSYVPPPRTSLWPSVEERYFPPPE